MNLLQNIRALGLIAALLAPAAALAQTTLLDQTPIPVPGAGNTTQNSESLIQSVAVPGGAVYWNFIRQPGQSGTLIPGGMVFVPGGAGSAINRFQILTDGHSDLGVPLTAAAGTPAGTVGVSRIAGTSLFLSGEATSASAKTDKVIFETNVAATYVPGANLPVVVNANYTGAGTVTAASTTLTVTAYTEIAGVETALTVSAAQQLTGVATNYTFTITGAASGLAYGSHIVIEITMLVTTSAGAATGQINSVALTM